MNNALLTLAAFLAYVVMSALLAPSPLLVSPLAEALDVPVDRSARVLGALNVGILIGALAAVVILVSFAVRTAMLVAFAAVVIALVVLAGSTEPRAIQISLFVAGMAGGIGLPAAASIIAAIHAGDRRASMLVITDGAFSLAAFMTVAAGGALLAAGFGWATLYGVAGVAAALVMLVCMSADFGRVASPPRQSLRADTPSRARLGVGLCAVALAAYTFGQFTMLLWLPTHLELTLGVANADSGQPVSRYWVGMLVGQLSAAAIVVVAGLRRLLPIAALLTVTLAVPLAGVTSLADAAWLAPAWGIVTFGLLKLILSYATVLWSGPPAPIVSVLLLAATSGTALAPTVSGWFVATRSVPAALDLAIASLAVTASAVILAMTIARPAAVAKPA